MKGVAKRSMMIVLEQLINSSEEAIISYLRYESISVIEKHSIHKVTLIGTNLGDVKVIAIIGSILGSIQSVELSY